MQKGKSDISAQTEMLALFARLESARGARDDDELCRLAEDLHRLSGQIRIGVAASRDAGSTNAELRVDAPRLAELRKRQAQISGLSGRIADAARRLTHALHFEDALSRVVVYSKPRTDRLRSLVHGIEKRQDEIEAAMAANRHEFASLAKSPVECPGSDCGHSRKAIKPAEKQNTLDRDDDEMF